jgi:hypothetical protein
MVLIVCSQIFSIYNAKYLIYPRMRYSCGGVEGWEQPVTDVLGHVEEFAFVPRHYSIPLLQIIGQDVSRQQSTGNSKMTLENDRCLFRFVDSPQNTNVCLENRHDHVVVERHIFYN